MKSRILVLFMIIFAIFFNGSTFAAERCHVAWSHYTTWELAGWIQATGVADRWGAKHSVDLKYVYVGDYIESVTQYTAGQFDGVTVTNMDALTIPAAGGIDTDVVVSIDFSSGGDGLLYKGPGVKSVSDLKGKKVLLVEMSVSHYMLARALERNGLSERDVTVVNVSDADIGSLIASDNPGNAYVTWNPILMNALNVPGVNQLFNSSEIPGEIIDNVMVNANASEACKSAVAGSYYEALSVMKGAGPESKEMFTFLADQAGGTEAEYRAMVRKMAGRSMPARSRPFSGAPGPEPSQT